MIAVGGWICLLAPLAGALAIVLGGTRISRQTAGVISTGTTVVAFGGAVAAWIVMLTKPGEERSVESTAFTWLEGYRFEAGLEILVDPLSVVMMLIVSGVGSLIVGYSVGYMHGDPEERRYFAYMSLFVFSMLLLVEGGNLLLLLAGWGLVGLASYLLIGFHHERESAIAAAKKAFVMNAAGDATMALALFLLVWQVGSLDYVPVFEAMEGELSGTVATLVALGLLGGAVAKSAQIPLHTWLPDAMEGPTPVSALIHAATMVTAGVYLLVRTHPIFEAAETVQHVAAGLGAVTLLVAGLVALVQVDIKRVIAYSTMSQIGYMFLAAGIGAYGSAIFHLMTHAFFKALLFLGAGVVIHALAGEQDMRRMGGLRHLMPRTYWAMLIGALALAGIFPLSGFWSKDSILAAAIATGGWLGGVLAAAGLLGALLTGIYAFRMIFLVFGGEPSAYVQEHHHDDHGREGPGSMTVPVAVLAVLSVVGGTIGMAGLWTPLADFLHDTAEPLVEPTLLQDYLTSLIAVSLGLLGIAVAWWIYGARRAPVPRLPSLQRLLEHKFWFDEAYDLLFYRPASAVARAYGRFVEEPLIAGSITGLARGVRGLGVAAGETQTGLLRTYVLPLAAGAAILALVFVSIR